MIIVTGLPRSGTTSVGRALKQMGLKTLFFCPLTQKNEKWGEEIERAVKGEVFSEQLHNFDAIVSWRLLSVHYKLDELFKPSHTILCGRSVGWETSMDLFGFSKIEQDLFKGLYYSAVLNSSGLKLDISEEVTYDEISDYLGIESQYSGKIPHLNKGKENYVI